MQKGVDGFVAMLVIKSPCPLGDNYASSFRIPKAVLCEGLGGDPALTEKLLDEGGMNWAYSEIFQNYDRNAIENYLPKFISL